MKLSRQTQKKFETFFRQQFEDERLRLPEVEIYIKRGSGIVTKILKVDGITIGRHIFIKPSFAKYNSKNSITISKKLLAHELTHVLQYQKLGFIGFLVDYLKEYLIGLKRKKKWDLQARTEAYWEIPHEVEARNAAEKFIELQS